MSTANPVLPKNNRTPAELQAQIDALEKRLRGFMEHIQTKLETALAELDVRVQDLEAKI
jgi:hypothetical protein